MCSVCWLRLLQSIIGVGHPDKHLFVAISRRFKDEQIDILVATDVAARGLDIEGVKTVTGPIFLEPLVAVVLPPCVPISPTPRSDSCLTLTFQVINFTMPNTIKHYVHRVGRTARAGRAGRSVSLVGEEERKMLKEIVKTAKAPVKARILPQGEQAPLQLCRVGGGAWSFIRSFGTGQGAEGQESRCFVLRSQI